MDRHGIAHHEKHKGQLFADHSAEDIIAMLLAECSGRRAALAALPGQESSAFAVKPRHRKRLQLSD
jgi:predicted flavoprotein YhiN